MSFASWTNSSAVITGVTLYDCLNGADCVQNMQIARLEQNIKRMLWSRAPHPHNLYFLLLGDFFAGLQTLQYVGDHLHVVAGAVLGRMRSRNVKQHSMTSCVSFFDFDQRG